MLNKLIYEIEQELLLLSRAELIPFYTKFFRAMPGDICEGDKLLAIKVPEIRKVVKKYWNKLSNDEIVFFLKSEYNEFRFFGQQVIVENFRRSSSEFNKDIWADLLLDNLESVNHWNLVDGVADAVFGKLAILTGNFATIEDLAEHDNVWHKRIAIVANLSPVKQRIFQPAISIIANNIQHPHEYIQKANGWVLREIGKSDENVLIDFLKKHWRLMPSVTKSYATERLRLTIDIKYVTDN